MRWLHARKTVLWLSSNTVACSLTFSSVLHFVLSIISWMIHFKGRKILSDDDKAEYSASRVDWERCVCSWLFQIMGQPLRVMR